MNKIVISGIVTSVLLVACGRPASDVVHPAIDPVQKPITTEQIEKIMWIAQDSGKAIKLGLSSYEDTNTFETHKGFHLWFCSDKDCNYEDFFVTGQYNIRGSNELCFTDIVFWNLPDLEYEEISKFFIKNSKRHVSEEAGTYFSASSFCTFATVTSEGLLKITVKDEAKTKVLDFSNEGEYN
jgi:hypothetical protein